MKSSYKIISFLLILSVYFLSCKKEKAATPKANIMVVNASPDSPSMDALINDVVKTTSPIIYPGAAPYFAVDNVTNVLKLNQSGTSNTLLSLTLSPTDVKTYSIFAVDSLSKLKTMMLKDDLTAPSSGKAKVRFIHLVPNAPEVDIAYVGGAVVAGGYSFMESTEFMEFSAGTYNFEIRQASTSIVLDTWPALTFSDGKIYTLFGAGFVGGTGTQAPGVGVIANN